MSEIDIEAVRLLADEFILSLGHNDPAKLVIIRMESALDQLAKENERLKAKLLESGEGANAVDQELGKVMRERDQAQAYNAQQDLVLDTLRTKHAAMQEAIVEAVRRADAERGTEPTLRHVTEPLRPHLPTPEPEPVDPLVEEIKALADKHGLELTQGQVDSIAAYFRPAEVRKIGGSAA